MNHKQIINTFTHTYREMENGEPQTHTTQKIDIKKENSTIKMKGRSYDRHKGRKAEQKTDVQTKL